MTIQETTQTAPADGRVAELAEALRGSVVRRGDDGYDVARLIWNGAHDRHPALIARCAGVADVLRAVEFARSENLLVAVRGGGHSIPGFSTVDDGLVIDLSGMQAVHVDPVRRTARVEAGATWSVFDRESQAFGLATTGGLVSSTGVAGFTLGGGAGWLMRAHGLASDNLISVDVVTADGRLLRASDDENPELFWGLRGGGGNFGVVTSFEFRLHPVGPTVTGGPVFYPGDRAGEVLRAWRDWADQAPDELTTLANLLTAPPVPFLPEKWHGKPLVAIFAAHSGPVGDGERDVSEIHVDHVGGAVGRVASDATAFGERAAPFLLNVVARTPSARGYEAAVAWGRDVYESLGPALTGGTYVNFLSAEGDERVRAAYGDNYDRLVALKDAYDPINLKGIVFFEAWLIRPNPRIASLMYASCTRAQRRWCGVTVRQPSLALRA